MAENGTPGRPGATETPGAARQGISHGMPSAWGAFGMRRWPP